MKSSVKLLKIACVLLAGGILFNSCNKNEIEDQTAKVPFKSISVTCDGETAQGELIDDQNIRFTFNEAEDFTSATISVELNEGYRMTYPESLTDVDLAATPVFNFADSQNKVTKYYIKFSSNAFPVLDEKKIQIAGLEPGEALSLDNTSKTLTIKYDQDKMNYESIVLTFLEGALQEGVEVPADLDFDFTEGIEQPLVFNFNGERTYTLKLDVSAYQKKQLSDFAFSDESFKYNLPEGSPVQVYAATGLVSVPISVNSDTKYDPSWSGNTDAGFLYGAGNPRCWEGGVYNEFPDAATMGYKDWSYDDIFCFPGDWKDDRTTVNMYGRLVIIYVDRAKVKVDMEGAASGVKFGDYNNLVVATGLNHTSQFFSQYLLSLDGQTVFTDGTAIPYRAAIGTKDGKLKFDVIASKGGSFYTIPYQKEFNVDRASLASAADQKWEVDNAAWSIVWGVRNGEALAINELIANDGTDYVSDEGLLGMGWCTNFYISHVLVGTTYDNKIALMINAPGTSNWDGVAGYPGVSNCQAYDDKGFNYHGYSLKQMLWLASQLGWKDAVCIGQGEDQNTYAANIKVNGVGVISPADAAWIPAEYGNSGADLTSGYVLTIDAK